MLSVWLMQGRPCGDERGLAAAALRELSGTQAANPVRIRMLGWRQAWTAIRDALFDESLPDVVGVGSTWRSGRVQLGVWFRRSSDMAASRWIPPLSAGRLDDPVPWTRDVRVRSFRRGVLARADPQAAWSGVASIVRLVRDDMAVHLGHTRRVLQRAVAEGRINVLNRRRLRTLPDTLARAALYTRRVLRLGQWLIGAWRGDPFGQTDEMRDETQALGWVLAL